MDPGQSEYYEFLDLTDIDDNERFQLNSTLFPSEQSSHDLTDSGVWNEGTFESDQLSTLNSGSSVPPSESDFSMNGDHHAISPQFGAGSQCPPPSSANAMYAAGGPASPYNMPQQTGAPPSHMYHMMQPAPLSNVYVGNMTANVNVHGYMGHYMPYISPGPVEQNNEMPPQRPMHGREYNPRGRRGRGGHNKSDYQPRSQQHQQMQQELVEAQQQQAAAYQQYMSMPFQSTYYHPAAPQSHLAQHATGSPLYVGQHMPMYAPMPHLYQYHPGMLYSPMGIPHEYQLMDPSVKMDGNEMEMYGQAAEMTQQMMGLNIQNEDMYNCLPNTATQGVNDYGGVVLEECPPENTAPVQFINIEKPVEEPNLMNTYPESVPEVAPVIVKSPDVHVETVSIPQPPPAINKPSDEEQTIQTVTPTEKPSSCPPTVVISSSSDLPKDQPPVQIPRPKGPFVNNKDIVKTGPARKSSIKNPLNPQAKVTPVDQVVVKKITEIPQPQEIQKLQLDSKTGDNRPKSQTPPNSVWVNNQLYTPPTNDIPENAILVQNLPSRLNASQNSHKTKTVESNELPKPKVPTLTDTTVPVSQSNSITVHPGSTTSPPTSVSASLPPVNTSSAQPVSTSGPPSIVSALPVSSSTVPPVTAPMQQTDVPVAAAPPPSKSWASLFNNKSNDILTMASVASPVPVINVPVSTPSPTLVKPMAMVQPLETAVTTSALFQSSSPRVEKTHEKEMNDSANVNQPQSMFLDDPNSYRAGEFLTKYTLDNRTVSLQPRGLTNRSNYCYINSTLQALMACPPLYNLLKALPYQVRKGKSSTPIIDAMVQLAYEFSPLPPGARVGRREKGQQRRDELPDVSAGPAFEPLVIHRMLNGIHPNTFQVEDRQEDAEEFLGCLLNGLNDEMVELMKLVGEPEDKAELPNGDLTNGDAHAEDDDDWKVMGPKNKGSITRRSYFCRTPISDIFRGQLRSRVQRAGDLTTDSVQPFFTLQLDIEKAASVTNALELLVGRDQLEGVTCSKTNQEVEAWQQVSLEELPVVLILHLKWFDYKLDGCTKIVKNVEFPIDLRIDSKIMSSKIKYTIKQRQYKLFAVVYHDGKEAYKGHYVTDVFHVGFNGWIRFDDSVVKAVTENMVLHPRQPRVPYLLYYRRCDTIGPPANTGLRTH